jgi:hypothetical protein
MNEDVVKYGMSRNYLPDWTCQDALREIYQNFQDYGDFKENVEAFEGLYIVSLSNNFVPEGCNFLKIGESGKRNNMSAVGKHGEGLKMAAMVLKRDDRSFYVFSGNNVFEAVFYDDEFLGECFGFLKKDAADLGGKIDNSFEVQFSIPKEAFDHYRRIQLSKDDVLHETDYGQLLKRPKGEVYVGGHFVGVIDGLKYAYNFKPEHVPLDRDRKVPAAFDVNWAAAQILRSWDGLTVKDMAEVDAQYMNPIPPKIAKKFKPELHKGDVVFRAGSVQASSHASQELIAMPVNQRRVAKMKFSLSKKRTPYSILKEFFDTHRCSLSVNGKVDMQVLLKKAKGWK